MRRLLLLLLLTLVFNKVTARADAISELSRFSVFEKIDLSDLAKSDVKTMHGPPMNGRFLSVQSCYVVPGSPAQQAEAVSKWNPTKHRELKVFLHSDLPASPAAENFSKLKDAPDNGAVGSFVSATEKMKSELQINKDEAKKFSAGGGGGKGMPPNVLKFWSDVLAARAKSFVSGGTAAQLPYNN